MYCLDDVTRLENIVNNYTENISLIICDYLSLFIKDEVALKDFLTKVTSLAEEKGFGVLLLTSLGRPGTTHCIADFRNNLFDDFEATKLVLLRDGFANSNEDQTTARVQFIKCHKNEGIINLLWNAETRSFSRT